jgi:hypothetical protein
MVIKKKPALKKGKKKTYKNKLYKSPQVKLPSGFNKVVTLYYTFNIPAIYAQYNLPTMFCRIYPTFFRSNNTVI